MSKTLEQQHTTPKWILKFSACAVPASRDGMKSVDPTKPYRKFEGMGHSQICCSFAESIKPCSQLL
jgi:hypothetical protein